MSCSISRERKRRVRAWTLAKRARNAFSHWPTEVTNTETCSSSRSGRGSLSFKTPLLYFARTNAVAIISPNFYYTTSAYTRDGLREDQDGILQGPQWAPMEAQTLLGDDAGGARFYLLSKVAGLPGRLSNLLLLRGGPPQRRTGYPTAGCLETTLRSRINSEGDTENVSLKYRRSVLAHSFLCFVPSVPMRHRLKYALTLKSNPPTNSFSLGSAFNEKAGTNTLPLGSISTLQCLSSKIKIRFGQPSRGMVRIAMPGGSTI